jgi:5-methylcytosine-specific restriction enzyme A
VRSERSRASHRLYQTAHWAKLRAWQLSEHPICEECGHAIATEVDHRRPHDGDPDLAFGSDNLRSMCKPCHSRKTVREDGGFGRARRAIDGPGF